MPYHNIASKTDRALVAYLISEQAGTVEDVYPAKRSLNKTLPCTICWSETFVETAPYSGTFTLKVQVMVKSSGAEESGQDQDQPRLAGEARLQATGDALQSDIDSAADKLGADITTAARAMAADQEGNADLANFTCLSCRLTGGGESFEDEAWVDTLDLEMVCCPANVS